MKTLYLAKEPDAGVRNDLTRLSGEVTVVDCLNAYGDYYRKMGYNVISKTKYFELDGTMRFDVVIGNPPYTNTTSVHGATEGGCSGGLDDKFYEHAQTISSCVSMIIRSKFFAKKGSAFRKTLFKNGGVVSIRALDPSTFPSISLTETCIVTWRDNYTGPTKITYLDGQTKDIVLDENTCIRMTNPDYVPVVENNMGYRYQRGDLNLNQLIDGTEPMIITMGGKKNDMIVKNVDKTQHTCCVNQHGVIMNSKYGGKGFGKILVKPYEHSLSGSAIILKTNSEEESVRLRDYLMSEEIYDISVKNKISNANTQELFKTIPDLI